MQSCSIALLVPLLAFSAPSAWAVTVRATAVDPERNFLLSNGTPVPNGNTVRIGGFINLSLDQAQTIAAAVKTPTDLDSLDNQFTEFGAISFNLGGPAGGSGRFDGTVVANTALLGLQDKQIYWWVTKTTGNSGPNSSSSNVQEWGLFTGSGSEWTFPQEVSPDTDAHPTSGTVGRVLAGKLVAGLSPTQAPNPGATPLAFSQSLQLTALSGAPIPEPSVGVLIVLGGWFWARRRR